MARSTRRACSVSHQLDTPTKKTWHAVDDKGECWKAVLDTKDGALLQDQVQKSDCGL